ncbi:RNA dependent RNA polymerase-domain-containing protein [Dichotomocladium elegans]|nr:RNA dependent RNA polymerase-domain-containing protein [Dichotomocladium elegans]
MVFWPRYTTSIPCQKFSLGVKTANTTIAEKWAYTGPVKFVINYDFRKITLYFGYTDEEYKAELSFRDFEITDLHPEIQGNQATLTMVLSYPAQFWIKQTGVFSRDRWCRVVDYSPLSLFSREFGFVPARSDLSPACLPLGYWAVYRVYIDLSNSIGRSSFRELLVRGKQCRIVPMGNGIRSKIFDIAPLRTQDSIQNTIADFNMFYVLASFLSEKRIHPESLTSEFLKLYQQEFKTPDQARKALSVLLKDDETRIWDPAKVLMELMKRPYFKSLIKMGKKKSNKKSKTFEIRAVFITPTDIILDLPHHEPTNRILRDYSKYIDRFLSVRFTDEGKRRIQTSTQAGHFMDPVYIRIKKVLNDGFQLGSVHYEFWRIRLRNSSMGDFSKEKEIGGHPMLAYIARIGLDKGSTPGAFIKTNASNVSEHWMISIAKHAARMGQCFSSTQPTANLGENQVEVIPDIERNDYTFSDGVGIISMELAKEVASKMLLPKARVLVINRASKYSDACLNRQIILNLSALGVPDSTFTDMMNERINEINSMVRDPVRCSRFLRQSSCEEGIAQDIANLVDVGLLAAGDPYLLNLLHVMKASKLKELKKRAKILIPDAAHLLGVMDETDTLKEDEVFCHLPTKLTPSILEGEVVIYRSPALHPGDVRKLKAVDCDKLRHLENVVVFSQQGERDVPSMCSGGDLDGDTYTAFSRRIFEEPMVLDKAKPREVPHVTTSHIQSFLVKYIMNDNLGQIANAHMVAADILPRGVRDPKCIRLAKLHSVAVDFPKKGISVDQYEICRPSRYPDYMEKYDKQTYKSEKILGILYRLIDETKFLEYKKELAKGETKYDHRFQMPGMEKYVKGARLMKLQYDQELEALLDQLGLDTEAEFMTGSFVKWYKQNEFRNHFEYRKRRIGFRWGRSRKIWPWQQHAYYVIYHPKERRMATTDYGESYRNKWYLSFAWIAQDLLCRLLETNQANRPTLSNLGEPIPEQGIQRGAEDWSSNSSTDTGSTDISDEDDDTISVTLGVGEADE